MRKCICLILSLAALISCDKEIALPYRSIEPLYVIEGLLTNEQNEVRISRTRDVESSADMGIAITGALVRVTDDLGNEHTLEYSLGGECYSSGFLVAYPGREYTLRVAIEGEEFTSTSRMGPQVVVEELYFQSLTILNFGLVMCRLVFEDIAGEENYYRYRITVNGQHYTWNILNDRGNDGQPLRIETVFVTADGIGGSLTEDSRNFIEDGDQIEFEIQTIDRRAYDYLYSVGLSERTSANPIDNFTGGCLGYFTAHSVTRAAVTFYSDNVMDEGPTQPRILFD